MKLSAIFILTVFLLLSTNLTAQWERVSQFNLGSDTLAMNDIYFKDAGTGFTVLTNTGVIFSMGGRILKTENGGQSWDTLRAFQDTIPMNITFTSENIGYIVCSIPPMSEMGIMKTVDGGDNWVYISAIVTANVFVQDIYFYNDDVGIYSTSGYSSITYDGGFNWSQINSNPHGGAYRSYLKDSIYVGTGGALLFYSTDTSQSYISDTLEWGGSSNYIFYDDGNFYVSISGNQGYLYDYPIYNFGIIAQYNINTGLSGLYHFPYQRTRCIAKSGDYLYSGAQDSEGGENRFLKSEDGGYTWWSQQIIEPETPSTLGVRKIVCVNDTVCYGMDGSYLYKTTNGGGPLMELKGLHYSNVKENQIGNDIQIFPNPATDVVHIQSTQKIKQIQVLNFSGKVLLTDNNGDTSIDVSQLSNGIYLLQLKTENGTVVRKLVKE